MSESDESRIALNVEHDNYNFRMHIRRNAPLKILMKAFCKRTNLEMKNLRFMDADSVRIQPRDTAEKLGLQDGDSISLYQIQHGGGIYLNNKD